MTDNDYEFEEDTRYFAAQKAILKVVGGAKRGLTITQIKKKIDSPFLADALFTLEGQGWLINKGSVLRPVYHANTPVKSEPTKICFFCSLSKPVSDFKSRRKYEKVCSTCRQFRTKPKKGK